MTAILRFWLRAGTLALVVAGYGRGDPALAQQRIGVNSAVNPEATGLPPGGAPRRLVLGGEVVLNERIATGSAGQTQILFVDGSSMSIGPNAFMLIDQYRYDPQSGAGSLVTSLARGLFRFVGGQLSKHEDAVTMRTPSATIGIHGGVMLADIGPGGELRVYFGYGKGVTVTGLNGVSQTIIRPGFEVTVAGPGASPSDPFPAAPGDTAALLAELDGRPGGNGGAPQIPTDVTVANSGIAAAISAAGPVAVQTTTAPANAATAVALASTTLQVTANNPVTGEAAASYAGNFKSTNGQGAAGGLLDPGGTGSVGLAFTGGTLSFPRGSPQAAIFSATVGGGQLSIPLPFMGGFAALPANGAGTSSPLGPVTGSTFLAANGTFLYANLTPVNAPSQREFIFAGLPVNQAFYAPTGAVRLSAFNVQPDAALQSPVPFVTNSTGGTIPSPSVSPFYAVAPANSAFGAYNPASNPGAVETRTLQASLGINGQGASQSSVLVVNVGNFATSSQTGAVVGYGAVRGSFLPNGTSPSVRIVSSTATVPDGRGNNLFGGATPTGFVIDQNGYNANLNFQPQLANQVAVNEADVNGSVTNYAFNQPVTAAALPSNIGASRTSQTLSGDFGGLAYIQTPGDARTLVPTFGSSSVTTDASSNQVAATFSGTTNPFVRGAKPTNFVLNFGGQNRSAFVDDNNFGAIESQTTASQVNGLKVQLNGDPSAAAALALVTSATVPSSALLANGLCQQCQFLQWGYWTGQVDLPTANGNAIAGTVTSHINTWVAGIPTVELPTSGVGTFTGNALGSVYNNGASYLAAGGFTNTYDFGARAGKVSFSNFDGKNFGGRVTAAGIAGRPSSYSGSLSGAGLAGAVQGTFFGPGAPETGGAFAVQSVAGSPYLASGIFAGRR
jgi:hypothetical protein